MSLVPFGFFGTSGVVSDQIILSLDASTHVSGNTTWANLAPGAAAVNLYYGATAYNQSNPSLLPQKSSSYGGSVFFSRTNASFAETFLPVDNTTPVITVELWGVLENATFGAWFLFGFFVNKFYGVYLTNAGMGFNTGVGDVYGCDTTRRQNVGSSLKPNHYVFVMYQTSSYVNGAIYINGVKSQQYGYIVGSSENASNRIFGDGRFTITGTTDNYFGDFYVGEFRVYKKVLSDSEVIQNYNATCARYSRPRYKPRVSNSNLQWYIDFSGSDDWYGDSGGYVTDFSQRMEWGNLTGGLAWDSSAGGNMQFRSASSRSILLPIGSNNIGIYYGSATFCFVVRMLDFSQNPGIIFHPTDAMIEGRGPEISFPANASFRYSHGSANPPSTLTNYGPLSANTWYHVAMSYNYDTYTVKIYINGQPVVTNGFQERQVSIHGYYIGRNTGQWYTFDLGLFMAWFGVRSDSEILEQYNYQKDRFGMVASGGNIIRNSLIFYYDPAITTSYPGSGTSITDLSGNSFTGTLVNGVGFSSSDGGILTFDGTNDYIDLSSTVADRLINQSFTVEFWLKPAVTKQHVFFTATQDGVVQQRLAGQVKSDGSINFAFYAQDLTSSAGAISVGSWQLITMRYRASDDTSTIFKNGSQIAQSNVGPLLSSTNRKVRIGQWADDSASEYWNGSMGAMYVYQSALTDSQIVSNYDALKSRYGL